MEGSDLKNTELQTARSFMEVLLEAQSMYAHSVEQ